MLFFQRKKKDMKKFRKTENWEIILSVPDKGFKKILSPFPFYVNKLHRMHNPNARIRLLIKSYRVALFPFYHLKKSHRFHPSTIIIQDGAIQ